ncbi:MAG: hypothetical protein AAES65_03965 [Candidatus Thiodiazotropha sp. (ex. Lucinoma kazani)]
MKVKRIAFGNEVESFVENRISDEVNVIFSDDNNRGKTLVMQGLMYSLGYESIFPSSFNFRDQYFYSEIERDGETYEFLRKNNSFAVRSMDSIRIFNSEREFRYFFDSNFFGLPRIIKDGKYKMVDFSLFYELFFIGQDNRSPSNLISKGQFNKADFKSMIFSLVGFSDGMESEREINELKDRIKDLKIKLKSVKKKISIIRANPSVAEIASKSYDSEVTQEKIKICRSINQNISEIKRARQREINRMSKLEALIAELNSLNRGLNEGNVKCGECGSEKNVYSNNDLTFEVSNTKVRLSILESIRNNILQKQEIIEEYTDELNIEQDKLAKEMESSPPNFQEVIVYQDNILSERDYDEEASGISNEIKRLEAELAMKKSMQGDNKEEKSKLLNDILGEMTRIYKIVDPNGNLVFDDLFTKKDSTFSGSEEQEYYFSRLIALNNILKHDFPIIVDSFRDGEVSTPKERKMLNIYKLLGKQVILTSTLKNEEYKAQKIYVRGRCKRVGL